MSTTYTAYRSNGNHANTQSVMHMYSWFNHRYNQELFSRSTKLISTAKFNMPDVILHGTYVISIQLYQWSQRRNTQLKAIKGGFGNPHEAYRKSLRVLASN